MHTKTRGIYKWSPVVAVALGVLQGCGGAAPTEAPEPETVSQGLAGGTAVVTNILWRVRVGSMPDYMSSIHAGEVSAFPSDGQVLYLPKNQLSGTTPLYRLLSPSGTDHMESMSAGEGGYRTESIVGYPFTSNANRGTVQIIRTVNPSTGDHGLKHAAEGTPAGYSNEAMPIYSWWRMGNQATSILALTAGGVTVESNGAAGGAVWHWTHNGVQYINNRDHGRQLQSSFFFEDKNPTEAGDRWGDYSRPAQFRHGSPVLNIHNTGTTQVTRAIPLEWDTDKFASSGAGADNPVVWKDIVLGKDLTLNFNNMGPVARYTTVITVPATIAAPANIEIPTGYLRASFNRFWTYNAQSQALVEVSPPNCDINRYVGFSPGFGGVIISDASTGSAMGLYGVGQSQGGPVAEFRLYKFFCSGDGGGEFAFDTSKFAAIRSGSIPGGTSTYNTWVMSGSLSNVTSYMNSLYAAGVR